MSDIIHAIFKDNEAGVLSVAGGFGMNRVVISGDIQIHNREALQILISKLQELREKTSFPVRSV